MCVLELVYLQPLALRKNVHQMNMRLRGHLVDLVTTYVNHVCIGIGLTLNHWRCERTFTRIRGPCTIVTRQRKNIHQGWGPEPRVRGGQTRRPVGSGVSHLLTCYTTHKQHDVYVCVGLCVCRSVTPNSGVKSEKHFHLELIDSAAKKRSPALASGHLICLSVCLS